MGHRDVHADPVALRPRLGHLLEPDRGPLPGWVPDRVQRPRVSWLVPISEYRAPEWPDRRDVERIDCDLEHLDRPARRRPNPGGYRQPEAEHDSRNLADQLHLRLGQDAVKVLHRQDQVPIPYVDEQAPRSGFTALRGDLGGGPRRLSQRSRLDRCLGDAQDIAPAKAGHSGRRRRPARKLTRRFELSYFPIVAWWPDFAPGGGGAEG